MRAVILAVLLLAIALMGVLLWHPLEQQWRYHRLRHETYRVQQQSLRYTVPRTRVIYSDVRNEASALLNRPLYYRVWHRSGHRSLLPPLTAAYCPPEFYASPNRPVVFCHGRTSAADGQQRIVIVQLATEMADAGTSTIALEATVSRPLKGPGLVRGPGRTCSVPLPWTSQRNTRVFAGQPDPLDPSHFTIDYEHNGTAGVIDGWLMSDNTVNFQLPVAARGGSGSHE